MKRTSINDFKLATMIPEDGRCLFDRRLTIYRPSRESYSADMGRTWMETQYANKRLDLEGGFPD